MYKHPTNNVAMFSNPAEMGEYCLKNNVEYTSKRAENKWTNYLSGAKAASLAITGDDSKVVAAQKLIDRYSVCINTSSFMDLPSVAGCYPCVPEALAGEPECMREPMEISSEHAPLSIVVDLASSGAIEYNAIEKRGTAILALVMSLSATRPITLKLFSCGNGYKNNVGDAYSIVTVDIDTTPIDLATAAYCLTNVGFPRQLFYALQKQMGFTGEWGHFNNCDRYAITSDEYSSKIKHYLEIDGDVLYIPGAISTDTMVISNPEKWLGQQLEKYQHGDN